MTDRLRTEDGGFLLTEDGGFLLAEPSAGPAVTNGPTTRWSFGTIQLRGKGTNG